MQPLRLLAAVTVIGFTVELGVMWLLVVLPHMPVAVEALADATLMTTLLFPALYFLSFRPLVRKLEEVDAVGAALRTANASLEAKVEERTAKLADVNRHLRFEIAEHRRSEHIARTNEQRYRRLFERNLAGVYRATLDGRILDCNLAFARLYGYDGPEAVMPLVADELFADPADRVAFLEQLSVRGSLVGWETLGRTRDGRTVWLLENASLVEDGDRQAVVIEGTVLDISQQKDTEQALQRALGDARARQAEFAGLLEGARAVLEKRDFAQTAKSIFDTCRRLIGATAGYVALLNEEATENEVVFLDSGDHDCTVDPALPMPIRGLREKVHRTGRVAYENDFESTEWSALLPDGHASVESVLFAPMLIADRVVGLLGLANKPGGFMPGDGDLAAAFAEIAAVALLNSRAEEALQRSRDELEARVAERTNALSTELAERHKAEAALRRNEAELRRFAEEQRVLYTVTAAATTMLDSDRLLEAALEAVLPVVGADAGWVTVTSASPGTAARVPAHAGVPDAFVAAEAAVPLDTCDTCWPLLTGAGGSKHLRLMRGCPRIPADVVDASGIHAHAHVALASGDNVYGILNVGWRQHHEYTDAEHALLEAIGRQIGSAMRRAELFQSEKRARLTAETLRTTTQALTETLELGTVLSTLLDSLRQLIPFDRARVMLRERDGRLGVRATGAGAGDVEVHPEALDTFHESDDPFLSDLLRRGRGTVIDDIRGHPHWGRRARPEFERSWMGVPLIAGKRVVGFFSLAKEEPESFTDDHLRLAESLSAPAAMALQNAWLFDDVRVSQLQQKTLAQQLVELQETERRAVARELHDEAGQTLSSLAIGLRLVERDPDLPDHLRQRMRELETSTDAIQEELHRLASNLHPASLSQVGLVPALETLVAEFNRAGGPLVQFATVELDSERLPLPVETALYRITQAALTNVIRHAHADRVSVLLNERDNVITLIIEDDGRGFDPEPAARRGRLGLVGMRERAEMLGGSLAIESEPSKGTMIRVEVPRRA